MVAPPLVTDVYQVTTIGLLNNQPCDHVINYRLTGHAGSAGTVCIELAGIDATAWMGAMGLALPPWYTHVASKAVYLGNMAVAPHVTTAGISGTNVEAWGSHANCVTIRHTVPVRGKGKQGRTNLPGPPTPAIVQPAGSIDPTVRADYEQRWANYQVAIQNRIASVFGNPNELVILDRKLGTFNLPNAFSCDLFPNTHRRWQKRLARH